MEIRKCYGQTKDDGLVGVGARDTCVSKNVDPAGDDLLSVLTLHALSN